MAGYQSTVKRFLRLATPFGGPGASVQPEWELSGVVSELPNRGTSYYHFEFNLNNVITRETIPLAYEVRVGR